MPAPVTAAPLFQMQARIRVPPRLPLAELRANLERIGDEQGVDIVLAPIP